MLLTLTRRFRPQLTTVRLLVVCSVLGCSNLEREQYTQPHDVAEGLLAAFLRGDSAAVDSLTADPAIREWLRAAQTSEPQLLQSAQGHLRAVNGSMDRDSAYVTFSFPYKGGRERLALDYVQRGGHFKVRAIGLPDRI